MQRLSQNKVLFFYSGSAAANLISEISMPGILYTYIRWKGLHKATWGGKNCLEVWRGLTCLYTDVKLGLSQVKINGYSEGWGCEQVFPVAFKSLNTQRIILWSRLFFFSENVFGDCAGAAALLEIFINFSWCSAWFWSTGWSKECLEDWGSFAKLAIPGLVMMCVEWWTYELGGFLAGDNQTTRPSLTSL